MTPSGVIRPTAGAVGDRSTNQRLPSGTATGRLGPVVLSPLENSVITCVVGSIRPIALGVPASVNQTLPSGPKLTWPGRLPGLRPALNSAITCVVGSITPIALVVPRSANHTFPSDP